MPPLLILFALVNLVIGSAAFVPSGILVPMAESLGVGVASAGQAMTAYALSTALLAPLLVIATGRWPRRTALMFALALFALGNAACALATSLNLLLAGRVLMGLGAMATPLMAGVAVSLVEPGRRAQALALVFIGMSLSYVVGVPLGTWLGFEFGWRWPLWGAAGLSLAMLGAIAWRMPCALAAPGASFAGLAQVLADAGLRRALLLTLLYFSAIFTVFTFIGPVLQALAGFGPGGLSLMLGAFGVAGVIGTVVGGRASDRFGPRRTLAALLALLTSMMALLPLSVGHVAVTVAVMLVWGCAGFGMMAPQQERIARMAQAQAPLALSLNTSMLYLGTATGAAIGAPASAAVGFAGLPWISAALAAAGWLLLVLPQRAPAASNRG